VVSERARGPDGDLTIQVARSLAHFDHESRELLFTFLLTGPLALLAAVGGGYFLARRALAPVDRITATANQITADQLSRRIEFPNPDDELGALGQTLNRMIGRLEQSFAEMQRFTADAAHELRTPLAVIRNEAEVALRAPRSPESYCQVLENLLEEVNRLSKVAEQLLFLSRQDAGLQPPTQEELVTEDLLQDVVGNMQLVAQEKGVSLVLQENVPCRIMSNARQLRRALYNLLDNALKYTQPPGRVTVLGVASANHWQVTITDTGIGIPPEHLPHVFERFYRVDPARAGDGGGAGLGLAICRSIIQGLRGRIDLESQAGRGTTVRVIIPWR
jgi:heavy metal sensor kinase